MEKKKLVSLATVLAMKPKVLLLDEPTSGLDPDTTERMVEVLKQSNLSYVFISHDMDFIMQTTNKVYGMIDGQITVKEEMVPHSHTHIHGFGRLPHQHSQDEEIKKGQESEVRSQEPGVNDQ